MEQNAGDIIKQPTSLVQFLKFRRKFPFDQKMFYNSQVNILFENCSQQTVSNQPKDPGANLPGGMGENPNQCVIGTYPQQI